MRSMVRAVVLFDIDGTLVRRAGPHHRLALAAGIRSVTGLETTLEGIDTSGCLDRDLIALMMRSVGASDELVQDAMPQIVTEAQRAYVNGLPDLRRRVCPGVRSALRQLRSSGCVLGLVTGNLSAIGWKKVEAAGLHRWFRFGAFAEQASTRAGLARIALRHARKAGFLRRGTPACLIGDHPNDIAAARLNGIRSIAVATGVESRTRLVRHRPDVLLPDLRCLRFDMLL
ncbi:MAG TPA: HAD family hydrolase [Bryobacteraceae bacterium]|nr:HAD family hydrolase [Bryobacteraceae bacterium]